MPRWGAVVVAAGSGTRFGSDVPKQFLPLAGVPLIEWSLSMLSTIEGIEELVAVLPAGYGKGENDWKPPPGVRVVQGGARRQDSVLAGLQALEGADMVLIHDGARPFPSRECVLSVMAMASRTGAAIPVLPIRSTVKRTGPRDTVSETVPRDDLRLSQTPQGFRLTALLDALEKAGEVTDECSAMEEAGHTVHMVPGESLNMKITDPGDWAIASLIADAGEERRTGTGLDFHPFSLERPLVFGGIRLEESGGLAGHSDGDALLHAVADALLAAARLGDIGEHFPPTDDHWKDADSAMLLRQVSEMVRSRRWEIIQVDATVIGERPKVLPIRERLIERIAGILDVDQKRVWVKGTTTNTLGDIGAGKGLGCLVQAVLSRDVRICSGSGPQS